MASRLSSALPLKSARFSSRLARTASRSPRVQGRASSSFQGRAPSPERPSFPCVEQHAARQSRIISSLATTSTDPSASGPEPPYARPAPQSYQLYRHRTPLPLTYATPLKEFDLAYETWGTLSPNRDNVILLHTGLSASSHAASTPTNPSEGWWEKFIGPGRAIDTNQFFVICTNVLGGCYGTTGPSSIEPTTGKPYATRFPVLSIFDMVRAQFCLLDHLGVDKLYASVGSSMGAMQSLAAGWMYPQRVGKVVSISGTARSTPGSLAMRYAQRSGQSVALSPSLHRRLMSYMLTAVLMADPNWNNGFYYDGLPPHTGLKLARRKCIGPFAPISSLICHFRAEIATITYRSGPEWDMRFGRQLRPQRPEAEIIADPTLPRKPALCPDFLIETYLDHQGEQFCLKYDANSLIYISKAMDLFDLTLPALESLNMTPPPSDTAAHASMPHRTSHSKS
ncbi:hypothetical protein EW146_g10051, partial [Bondarzewia mesenterica]